MERNPNHIGDIVTAGAYVLVDGLLAFAIGAKPNGNRLAVVRLGGHREPDLLPGLS